MVKEQGKTVTDLSQHGQEFMAAFGGAGGKGNRFFLSNENRAPMTSTHGEQGQERVFHLELRTMAHAGLVRTLLIKKKKSKWLKDNTNVRVDHCVRWAFLMLGSHRCSEPSLTPNLPWLRTLSQRSSHT